MRKATAMAAGLIGIVGSVAFNAMPVSAASATVASVNCTPATLTPGGLTANITCSYVNGFANYQVRVLCPNYGWRYGPIRPVGQSNYAACLSASAGEGPVQAVEVRGV